MCAEGHRDRFAVELKDLRSRVHAATDERVRILSELVIEHDMPFIMGISDRVYCLEAGRIISDGSPQQVRHDPKVIASYLGTDERAIARSGAAAARPAGSR